MSAMVRKRPFKASVRMVAKCQQRLSAAPSQDNNRAGLSHAASSRTDRRLAFHCEDGERTDVVTSLVCLHRRQRRRIMASIAKRPAPAT